MAEVDAQEWGAVLHQADPPQIQPADAQVFVLARSAGFRALVLTDDLALRRMLEQEGASAVGSVGLLIRAYTSGKMDWGGLEGSIEALLNASTLHLSRPFRTYIRKLIAELP